MNKEQIKETIQRLERFKPELKKEILGGYKYFKESNKGLKEYKGKGFKITSKGLEPYTFISSIEEQKKENINKLKIVFRGDRYSSKDYLKRNARILKEIFKEDKEILKILNYSWNKLRSLRE